MPLKLGIGKKKYQPVDTEIENKESGHLPERFPYLEEKAREHQEKLKAASHELEEIQRRVRTIKKQKELMDFIINNKNVNINCAWIIDKIQQVKDPTDEYDITGLEQDIMDAVKQKRY
jgi:hypothetical protein